MKEKKTITRVIVLGMAILMLLFAIAVPFLS